MRLWVFTLPPHLLHTLREGHKEKNKREKIMCHLRGRFKVLSSARSVNFHLSHWTKIELLTLNNHNNRKHCFMAIITHICGFKIPDAIYTGISSLPIDIERSARVPVNLKFLS